MVHVQEASLSSTSEFAGEISPVEAAVLRSQQPQAHLLALRDNQLVGRCSIWMQKPAEFQSRSTGIIGHFAAGDPEAAHSLLNHAVEQIKRLGGAMAVGPMDGNTWRRYRLLTQRGPEPAFFLEPDNPDVWPAYFQTAGFTPLAQ